MAADAGKACAALMRKLGAELKAALAQSGPEAAIGVCKTRAPQMTAEVSKAFGFEVKRVSPKNRTLAAVPDASEAGAHAGLEKRLAPEYPLDKATGYGLSMVRGIVSVKRQL